MSPAAPAAVLIVPGAYFSPGMWADFEALLRKSGFAATTLDLPTAGEEARPPTASVPEDAAVMRSAVQDLVAAGHRITIIAHSYGGMVANCAITPDLYSRAPQNKGAGVESIIYIAALLFKPSMTLAEAWVHFRIQTEANRRDNGDGTSSVANPAEAFFNDLPSEVAARYEPMLVTQNRSIHAHQVPYAPWRDVKAVYVLCERDMTVLAETQEALVRDCDDAGGQIEVVRVDAGHCPFYSQETEMLSLVERVAGKA